ncbi:helix-turn-helix domain-containing protein [Ktedonospora formicarum]|uniref:AraC family transcriptional regulator n=1 Tax=Ktedonospora formicarum TaxID=2778364 RepID=A0A8J3I8L7_9CHLR|nr:helix-turn-helix domain-containing protein [Ktedonospora formicarum]GHO47419.1 AraC family transcriptional regulator [Ktedonospora formicarum]
MRQVVYDVLGVASGSSSGVGDNPLHRHQEIELNFAEQGAVTYLFGGKTISIQAGQVAAFWGAIPHRLVMKEEQTTLHWLTIPLGYLLQWSLPTSFTGQIMDGILIHDQVGACAHFDQRIFRRWRTDLHQAGEELRAIVLLESAACLRRLAWSRKNLLHEIKTSDVSIEGDSIHHTSLVDWRRAERAASFIAAHYQHTIHVDDLAQELGLHPHSVMRLFQKTFGVSIVEYITQYRLAHAQRLLATTESSVIEIATDSGFGSLSHFYSVFTRACGRSPQAYRHFLSSSVPNTPKGVQEG